MLWAGLRWSDAQRLDFESVILDGGSVRGWCWRTKTSAACHWHAVAPPQLACHEIIFKAIRRGWVPLVPAQRGVRRLALGPDHSPVAPAQDDDAPTEDESGSAGNESSEAALGDLDDACKHLC